MQVFIVHAFGIFVDSSIATTTYIYYFEAAINDSATSTNAHELAGAAKNIQRCVKRDGVI